MCRGVGLLDHMVALFNITSSSVRTATGTVVDTENNINMLLKINT